MAGHAHDHAGHTHLHVGGADQTRRLRIALAISAALLVTEFAGGLVANSLALLADAGHLLTDVAALGLSLFVAWFSRRPETPRRTYGYLRLEILAAFVNGGTLLLISALIIWEAVARLRHPEPVASGLMLVVAVVGFAANLASARVLHPASDDSLNLRGAYLHILGDVLGSVGAIGAAVIIAFTGWTMADPIISIAISLLILIGAWRLVRESTDILLEAVPKTVSMEEVQRCMLSVGGVTAVHDLHVWTVTSGMVAMSGHAVVPDLGAHPGVLEGIRSQMAGMGIGHVTIQLEVEDGCAEPGAAATQPHDHAHSHPH